MQFLCLDGVCISEEKHCNGEADCEDGTDERNCGKAFLCHVVSFLFIIIY